MSFIPRLNGDSQKAMMLSSSKLGIDGCVDVIIDGLRGMGEMENE